MDEINTDILTSYPNHATTIRSVLPTSTGEKNSLILRLIRSVSIAKIYYLPIGICFLLPMRCSPPLPAVTEIRLYLLNRSISQINGSKSCEHGNEHPAHIIWTYVIPLSAASPVASQKHVFYGLLEFDERVYIGMTVTFDQTTLNGELISWNSQKICSTGVHSNNFLSVNEWNQLHIQEQDNSNYPEEILFFVEDLDSIGLFISS